MRYSLTPILLCILMLLLWACDTTRGGDGVIDEVESPYHHIQVVEREQGKFRDMKFGRLIQATMVDDKPDRLVYPYARSAFLGLTIAEEPRRVLFIGLGGGIMSNVLRQHYPETDIDIVDIDPAVVKVAKDYFHFAPDARTRVIVEDGRIFLRKTEQRYDLIFLDTFNAEGVPFHLTTREFLALAKSRLTGEGCLVSHFWGDTANRLFSANIRTHQEVFANVYLLNAENSGDYIMLATAEPQPVNKPTVVERAQQLMKEKPFHFDLAVIAAQEFRGPAAVNEAETILTDDYAPVDVMRYQEQVK